MRLIKIILFVLVLLIGKGCRQSKPVDKEVDIKIEKDIPINKYGDSSWYYKRIHEVLLSRVHLPELRNGFDSLQIRVWYSGYKNDDMRILIIKKQKDWSAVMYRIQLFPEVDSIKSIKSEIITTPPRSGWVNFLKELIDLEILTLPDYKSFNKYPDCTTSGEDVTVEIATINKYRIYSYPCVRGNPSPVLDKINRIFSFINSEFKRDIRN